MIDDRLVLRVERLRDWWNSFAMIFDRGIRNHIARWSLRRSEIRLQLWESGGWSRLAHEKTCVRAVVGVRNIGPPEY